LSPCFYRFPPKLKASFKFTPKFIPKLSSNVNRNFAQLFGCNLPFPIPVDCCVLTFSFCCCRWPPSYDCCCCCCCCSLCICMFFLHSQQHTKKMFLHIVYAVCMTLFFLFFIICFSVYNSIYSQSAMIFFLLILRALRGLTHSAASSSFSFMPNSRAYVSADGLFPGYMDQLFPLWMNVTVFDVLFVVILIFDTTPYCCCCLIIDVTLLLLLLLIVVCWSCFVVCASLRF